MRPSNMNMASKPFVNEQPVIRTSVLLWVLGLALLALNVALYTRHIEGKGEQQDLLMVADERLVEETMAIERLRGELEVLSLEQQNEQVSFLNSQIALRVFSWSALFDRLAEVVPAAIQLQGISPDIVEAASADLGSRLTNSPAEVVKVGLQGTSRAPEAVLELVDALFAHSSFSDPNLARESFAEGEENRFSLSVLYLPPRDGEENLLEAASQEPAKAGEEGLEVDEEGGLNPVGEMQESVEGGE